MRALCAVSDFFDFKFQTADASMPRSLEAREPTRPDDGRCSAESTESLQTANPCRHARAPAGLMPGMTKKDTLPRSRDTPCPSFAKSSAPKKRAQGRPGARCTRGLACKGREEDAHEHTGSAEAVRPSLRNGFTAYFALSPVIGFLATVAPEKLASQELDASVEASGPHDFAVRVSAVRLAALSRPSLPAPNVRDDRDTPLLRARDD